MIKNNPIIQINNLSNAKINFDIEIFIEKALKVMKLNPIFLEFSIINDTQIKKIHKKYMDLDTTTDVITFNLNTTTNPHGDIYICIDEAERNAAHLHHSVEFEIKTLIIHALLHLIGFTDSTEKEKEKMFTKQNQLLKQLVETNEFK